MLLMNPFQWPVFVRAARMSETIIKLERGAINNSNNNKKNLEKNFKTKYNKFKWVGAPALSDLTGSCSEDS